MPPGVTCEWRLLRAGAFRLDGGSMFGVVPKPIWAKMVTPDERNRIPLQTNCVLIEPEVRTDPSGAALARRMPQRILIETGYGEKWSEKERDIYSLEERTVVDALREAGVTPEEIDLVIVTHLHFDHAGALPRWRSRDDREPIPTFPNAKVFVQRREWEDALANRSTMTRTYLRSHLDPIAHQVELVEGESIIVPEIGLRVLPDPGHTWGQQAVLWQDKEGTLCFPGDLIPTVNHAGLPFSMGYDMLPYENMLNKKAVLERAIEENWRFVLDHEPGNPIVRPERDDSGRITLSALT